MSTQFAESLEPTHEPFAAARIHAAKLEATLSSDEMIRKPHTDIEELCAQQGREWARLMFEENVRLRAQLEQRVDVHGADGVERTSVRDSERKLETVLGTIPVPRMAYQAPGSQDLHPMDAVLNLPPERFSYGIRRMVAKEVARASFDEVVEIVHDYTGAQIAKRQVEELAVRAALDFDAFYEQREPAVERSDQALLVISTDAKGVVMRHEDLREATRLAAEKKVYKLETRLTPGEKSERKRMAQVATVYWIEPWPRTAADVVHTLRGPEVEAKRPRPADKRVWASVEKHPGKVIREAFEEALRRDPDKRQRWVVLVDGERKQLRAVKAEARRVGVKLTILVDVVHVLEYVWKAARAIFGESSPEAEDWVGDRLLALLTGRTGGQVAATIRRWADGHKDKIDEAGRKQVAKACKYLSDRTRTRMMHYEQALHDGLPIATGVVEGACRYLVKDRMDRTGARWGLTSAEAVLRLRALRTSGDFDAYWQFHLERERERNHTPLYEGGSIPDALPAPKRPLRRVK
jgi:hypothetical protein